MPLFMLESIWHRPITQPHPGMDDDVCKLLTDLVRCSMKRCHQDQSDPEPITTWGLYAPWAHWQEDTLRYCTTMY